MHFTYCARSSGEELHQGDLLRRSTALVAVLREVHPHYTKLDYTHFMVLTQSCDLVRRGGDPPRSRYVTIAAVRPAHLAIKRASESQFGDDLERTYHISDVLGKGRVREFIIRLLNNNEAEYFYLRADPKAGIQEDHCAFLRLSISLKAELHYETLRAARIVGLQPEFEHKLGFWVGHNYARVATADWIPDNATEEEWKAQIRTMLTVASDAVTWLPRDVLRMLKERLADADQDGPVDPVRVAEIVRECQRVRDKTLGELLDVVEDVVSGYASKEVAGRVRYHLANEENFRKRLK